LVSIDNHQLAHGGLPLFFKYRFIGYIRDRQMICLRTRFFAGAAAYTSGRVDQNSYKLLGGNSFFCFELLWDDNISRGYSCYSPAYYSST
jgi:hypothetical protein